jgi:hypothetical protein
MECWLNTNGLLLLRVHQRHRAQWKGWVSSWFEPKIYSSNRCSACGYVLSGVGWVEFCFDVCRAVNGAHMKHFFMNILCIVSFSSHTKTHNWTLLFGSVHLKNGRHFDHWNQPLNMFMCICYLDFHDVGIVLLPSDKHIKPIMSITGVLLPFVTYLLTALRD